MNEHCNACHRGSGPAANGGLRSDDLTILLKVSKRKVWEMAAEGRIPGRIAIGRCAR
jgi:hypothetical protein